MANHYCTYFDQSFLAQGFALFASLQQHDSDSVLWVLCLDDFTAKTIEEYAHPALKPVVLAELEANDPELAAIKPSRRSVEYYFTLSPCWPRYLLKTEPSIDRLTYVDSDLYFFSDPAPIFEEMADASILVIEHRYPAHLAHHLRLGRFNVGLLSFRNDDAGLRCLDWWRERCIEWCYDRAEDEKYADQKYLDEWPTRFGQHLHVLQRAGANLAPWNWSNYRYTLWNDRIFVEDKPLEVFHFARFRPTAGTFWFQSGQLEYGVMPWRIRQLIYGRYWQAVQAAVTEIRRLRPEFTLSRASARQWHGFWRALLPRMVFGSDWLRIGPWFLSGRFSLGRYSGYALSWLGRKRRQARASAAEALSDADALTERAAFIGPPQHRE